MNKSIIMEHLGEFIMNHWLLWSSLIIILLIIVIYELMEQKNKASALSPQSAVEQINHHDAKVIDTRDKEAYQKGHIIDSIHLDKDNLDNERLNKLKNKPIILVCDRGLQSPALAAKLHAKGFQQVMVLNGGIANWQTSGLPTVEGKK